jgi:DNA-binding NtrC family response regulator
MKFTDNRKVLIVDDDEDVREGLERLLSREGHSVVVAESGEAALAVLRDPGIRLVISDNHMSGMSGLELFKRLRKERPHLVRVMLTADDDPGLAVRSINEGEVFRYVKKPWNNADILTIVQLALELSLVEEEKRELLEIVRRLRAARARGEPAASLESELLLLGQADLLGS